MSRIIPTVTACLACFIAGCTPDIDYAERQWRDQLSQNLAIIGARNWIVVAESSFPAYTGPGIRTMVSDKPADQVLLDVLEIIEAEAHVVPRIMVCTELRSVTEDYAPGIKAYRKSLGKMLPGRQNFELMSRTINSLIEDAAKQFNVLVIKTKTQLPYSNIYIELDSGYWNSESETHLRKSLPNQDTPTGNRALDVPLMPSQQGVAPNPIWYPQNPSSGPLPTPPHSLPDLLPQGTPPRPSTTNNNDSTKENASSLNGFPSAINTVSNIPS